jgi:hypothetical protein
MDETQTPKSNAPPESNPTKIDRNAPAGSENSLGAQSVPHGRPSTDDCVMEAIDEETPVWPVTNSSSAPRGIRSRRSTGDMILTSKSGFSGSQGSL